MKLYIVKEFFVMILPNKAQVITFIPLQKQFAT
jgi:hypothetical protein